MQMKPKGLAEGSIVLQKRSCNLLVKNQKKTVAKIATVSELIK
jgi:hypothetical protein